VADEMGGWMRVWQLIKESIDPQGVMNPRAVGGNEAGSPRTHAEGSESVGFTP
jgi:hypothetical protein